MTPRARDLLTAMFLTLLVVAAWVALAVGIYFIARLISP